ncbi:MAG: S41 family peptidase [Chloroflexota bacterium]
MAPSGVYAQPTPSPAVKQAFDLLMDRFVTPPSSAVILAGGWRGGVDHVNRTTGRAAGAPAPQFSGDRASDWDAFTASYSALTAGPTSVDPAALDRAIVAGMAESLKSNDTYLVRDTASGVIGVRVTTDLVVIEVSAGGPAESAGIRPGDQIVAVDGTPVTTQSGGTERIRGPVGTPVELTLRRGGTDAAAQALATRTDAGFDWVEARVLGDGIGYLRLRQWPATDAIPQFESAISLLEQAGIRGLVIDVRNARGGAYATFERIASRFIATGPLYQRTNRQGNTTTVSASGGTWSLQVPILVLVDADTRSQSELLAMALRENAGASIVGAKTAGAVTGGNVFPLDDGTRLVVTTLQVRSGLGHEINGVGLEPDLPAPFDRNAAIDGRDSQLQTAVEFLRAKAGQ